MKNVSSSEPACKASVLERTIEVVARIVSPRVVPDPLAIGVNVRSFRVAGLIAERALRLLALRASALLGRALLLNLLGCTRRRGGCSVLLGCASGSRAMRRNVTASDIVPSSTRLASTTLLALFAALLRIDRGQEHNR